jgi:hypothetical protein
MKIYSYFGGSFQENCLDEGSANKNGFLKKRVRILKIDIEKVVSEKTVTEAVGLPAPGAQRGRFGLHYCRPTSGFRQRGFGDTSQFVGKFSGTVDDHDAPPRFRLW